MQDLLVRLVAYYTGPGVYNSLKIVENTDIQPEIDYALRKILDIGNE